MNIDENVTIFKIPPQVDKHLKVQYAKCCKPPFKVVILSTYNCTQAKVDKQNFQMSKHAERHLQSEFKVQGMDKTSKTLCIKDFFMCFSWLGCKYYSLL
jgi:hypothetical protein